MTIVTKHYTYFSLLLLWSITSPCVVPYLNFRSQGFNAARELAGWQSQINRPNLCTITGSLSVTPQYTRSFNAHTLENSLFGQTLTHRDGDKNSCSKILIQGTKVINRDSHSLMAENFYLPTDFKSELTFCPVIDNFILDLNFYLGMDEWAEGLYFRVHMPITHSRWNLNFREHVIDNGSYDYDPGYMTMDVSGTPDFTDPLSYGLKREAMLENFTHYVYDSRSITNVKNIIYKPLERARMNPWALSKTGIAEITTVLGWNFLNDDDYCLGVNIRAAAPTGIRPEGYWLFEPVIGNGMHWEVGLGIDSRYRLWCNCNETSDLSIYCDVNLSHLFPARQCRTFDLKNKPLSRYMLALTFDNLVQNLLAGDEKPQYQFTNQLVPLANLTTMPIDVDIQIQTDAVIDFAYTYCNWQAEVGYNFWARTCEKLCRLCDCCCDNSFKENTYGLKGDAFIYGFPGDVDGQLTSLAQAVPLSATQSNAVIEHGTNNWPSGIDAITWNQNPGIDCPYNAYDNSVPSRELLTHEIGITAPLNFGWTQVKTSRAPILLKLDDIDIDGARTRGYSNKIFGTISYIAREYDEWIPYCSIGTEVEFASHKGTTERKNCIAIALSQWGVWFKGGFSFN